MDWITGMQNAIDYIEDHITEKIDYEKIAAQGFSSSYHFQRVFSILCGFTVGEYIRNRRLTLAGKDLASGHGKILDVALKYGYESPDSFARAFQKFHGILPSEARENGSMLNSFSRLVLKISMEGGTMMNYRIEEKPEMILTGYRTHFSGAPYGNKREQQEEQLFLSTRGKQWFLRGVSNNSDPHCVITNITDEGYDFYYCHLIPQWERENLYNTEVTGIDFTEQFGFENICIPKNTYVVFETTDVKNPICDYMNLLSQRIEILTQWLPEAGLQLGKGPEMCIYHWMPKAERNVQIWMPVEKIEK